MFNTKPNDDLIFVQKCFSCLIPIYFYQVNILCGWRLESIVWFWKVLERQFAPGRLQSLHVVIVDKEHETYARETKWRLVWNKTKRSFGISQLVLHLYYDKLYFYLWTFFVLKVCKSKSRIHISLLFYRMKKIVLIKLWGPELLTVQSTLPPFWNLNGWKD